MMEEGFAVIYNDTKEVVYYYSGESNEKIWSTNPNDALRFLRKEDAQRFIKRFIVIKEAVPSYYLWNDAYNGTATVYSNSTGGV
jgi:hypothetical protein